MTAKEMFEKLGYGVRYSKSEKSNITFITVENDNVEIKISDKGLVIFENKCNCFLGVCTDFELMKAINKQIEELGWDNE